MSRIRLPQVFPPCHRVECFANKGGRCVALKTAYERREKACPFFKTQEEYEAGVLKYGGLREEYLDNERD